MRRGAVYSTSLVTGLAAAAFVALGCAAPGSQRIVGPDGSEMAHVHCGSDQGTCFRIAGELCPSGYDLQPVLSGSDGNFLVRCRRAKPSAPAVAQCAPPAATPVAQKPSDVWPPSNEPWPATYPWTAPETSAVVQAPPGAPAKAPIEIDLGY